MADKGTITEQQQEMERQASEAAKKAEETISESASQAREKAREFGQAAANQAEEKRQRTAEALHGAASAMHERAEHLPGGRRVSGMAHSAADKVNAAANYVQTHSTRETLAKIKDLVQRHPAQSLLMAAGIGFLFGRVLRNR